MKDVPFSFQEMMKKMQKFFFGEEESTFPSSKQEQKPERSYGRVHSEGEVGAKMLHQYPEKGNFRFPLNVDDTHPPRNRKPVTQKTNNSPSPIKDRKISNSKGADANSTNIFRNPADKEVFQKRNIKKKNDEIGEIKKTEQVQRKEENDSAQNKSLFSGTNFEPQSIPSPVFGYEKVPLHQDYLKKRSGKMSYQTSERSIPSPSISSEKEEGYLAERKKEKTGRVYNTAATSIEEVAVISELLHRAQRPNPEPRKVERYYVGSLEEGKITRPPERDSEEGPEESFHKESFQESEKEYVSQIRAEKAEGFNDSAWQTTEDQTALEAHEEETLQESVESSYFGEEKSISKLEGEVSTQEEGKEKKHTAFDQASSFPEVETPSPHKSEPVIAQKDTIENGLSNSGKETAPQAARKAATEVRSLQKGEKTNMAKRKNETGQPSVPFNVLMYPKDRMKSEKKKNSHSGRGSNGYTKPSIQLLNIPPRKESSGENALAEQRELLERTLHNFNVDAKVVEVTQGPSVTRFEVQPAPGVKVNKVTNLTDDIKMAMAAKDLRMEAPIPGKNAIGIEVPNPESTPVFLREILRHESFIRNESPLAVALGLDISGGPIVADLQKMPHGLIAGATGSGKSVCINSILLSLLFKASPEEVKLMLIDPKMVELASYREIPHLVTPVINDAKEATAGLKWAVQEMDTRYEKLAHEGVRDIKKYNEKVTKKGRPEDKMPYMVIIIDELADLMMVSPQDVEDAVCRIAQKARACGMHLLLATQRPSVDVITGLIKANIPTRVAFSVSSQVDSRTILDMSGAERLIGKGDMLFHANGASKPLRVQGTFVSDEEIDLVTEHVRRQQKPAYFLKREELVKKYQRQEVEDDLFMDACEFVTEQGSASSSLLQRQFSIGFNRAARLIDMMEAKGIISEAMGTKPRRVLLSMEDIEEKVLQEEA
ncbi:DNA translocase FtsK [Bacillus sp. FJAT-44742]|uniref:DNA translocase FtsK n=1 Tax=Bacillus sp. FJAT-44742 TaxID=2014005 RepID=UPI001E3BE415|nr:DNA translocase FtsK [Bacillus sp. FJAT-44742]